MDGRCDEFMLGKNLCIWIRTIRICSDVLAVVGLRTIPTTIIKIDRQPAQCGGSQKRVSPYSLEG